MIDKYGLYVQNSGDGGDAAHRTGLAYALQGLIYPEDKKTIGNIWNAITRNLRTSNWGYAEFIRHPHPLPGCEWQADPQCFSRDQASRLILGFAINGDKNLIKSWFKAMASRAFFHQNNKAYDTGKWKVPDVIGPGEIRNVIRGLDLWYLYPVLFLLDLLFITDIYTRSKWDGASLYVPDLKYAQVKYPTPASKLANYLNDYTPWLDEVLVNHSVEKNGCVELQELFKKLAEK